MSKVSIANLRKTILYCQRNGIKNAIYAALERLQDREEAYRWEPVPEETLRTQSREATERGYSVSFSIVVPAYRTPEPYLREMIQSVLDQSYGRFELIIADASGDDSVKEVVETYEDSRIRYRKLGTNEGISRNTNAALAMATMDYVGLLDHDDVLTADALFCMAAEIEKGKMEKGKTEKGQSEREIPLMLYSDEDKCNSDRSAYYEPHRKREFNLDLILTNNYICHFLVMKRELIQNLGLRDEYDGAQDFDLVLRGAERLMTRADMVTDAGVISRVNVMTGSDVVSRADAMAGTNLIAHIPKVLYHWRCHASSTAENPRSKLYAYEAGRRAVQDFLDRNGIKGRAVDTKHLGFYRVQYSGDLFACRKDVCAYGGSLIRKGKIVGGCMSGEGDVLYEGLSEHQSGYLHRAVLQQDAEALDIRNIRVRKEYHELFENVVGVPYREEDTGRFDSASLPDGTDYVGLSCRLCEALRKEGGRLLYLPDMIYRLCL